MTNIYYYSDLGSAQRDGVHINESHKGEKGPTYTSYNGVERNISGDEEKACAIIVACALAVLTLGIIFIFSPDFRANLFGRNVVTVNVEDPKEKTAAKTDDAAQNKIPKAPFDINGASIFDIHARFLDEIGRVNNRAFFALSGQEMLDLSRRLPRNTIISLSPEETRKLLNTLPLERLTAKEFAYFFNDTGFLAFATKEQIEKLTPHLRNPDYYAKISDTVFQELTITAENVTRIFNQFGKNVNRLSVEQIKESFSHLTPYLHWLTLSQMNMIYQNKHNFTNEELITLKMNNIHGSDFLVKKPFSYTLTVKDLPPKGTPLRTFYDKFKKAEKDKKWHEVFGLKPGFTKEKLNAVRKKIMIPLYPDKNPVEYRDAATHIIAAFNSLSDYYLKE